MIQRNEHRGLRIVVLLIVALHLPLFALISSLPKDSSLFTLHSSLLYAQRPTLTLKSNMIYWAATAPNIALELPIDQRGLFSLEVEYMQPWWIWRHNTNALQGQHFGGQLKFWLGNRAKHRRFYGEYIGIHVGTGYYDLQRHGTGYQGEYLMGGLNFGYVFSIGKNIALDAGLGLGLLNTDFRKYENDPLDRLQMWKEDGDYRWIGPTNVHLSFVWTPTFRKKP